MSTYTIEISPKTPDSYEVWSSEGTEPLFTTKDLIAAARFIKGIDLINDNEDYRLDYVGE